MMETQVRTFRSSAMVRSLAHLRGAQSGLEYAESFKIIRFIEQEQ